MTLDRRNFIAAVAAGRGAFGQSRTSFSWPDGKRVAVSLSFDDARLSQVDTGLELFRRLKVPATFYLSPNRAEERLEGWKKAVAEGHDIGNHSGTHPCTGNYRFSRNNALEDYTLERMTKDIETGHAAIERLLGVKPLNFAYPCGQKFVGRGAGVRSYVPVVAERYLSGRGYLDESANDPQFCDLAQLMGTGFDGLTFESMRQLVSAAAAESRWIVFVGHEIGRLAPQGTDAGALEQLCRYAQDPANGVWLDTVAKVAGYVKARRG